MWKSSLPCVPRRPRFGSESKHVVLPKNGRRKLVQYVVHRMAPCGLFLYKGGVFNSRQVPGSAWCAADQGSPADLLRREISFFFRPAASAHQPNLALHVARQCLRPLGSGRDGSRARCVMSSRVAPLARGADGAARHPYLGHAFNTRIVSVKTFSAPRFHPAIQNNSGRQLSLALETDCNFFPQPSVL